MSVPSDLVFKYRELTAKNLPSSHRTIRVFRPIIPLILLYHDRLVQTAAILDTGADFNVFHADVADYLGIRLTTGKTRRISGISKGMIKGYEHKLDIKVGPHRRATTVTFSRGIPDNSIAVLGNNGFFNHFVTTFNYRDQEIILNPYSLK